MDASAVWKKLPELRLCAAQIVVHGLPWSVEWQELKDLAKQYGDVVKADVVKRQDGKSRGFGTIVFKTPEDAQAAIKVLRIVSPSGCSVASIRSLNVISKVVRCPQHFLFDRFCAPSLYMDACQRAGLGSSSRSRKAQRDQGRCPERKAVLFVFLNVMMMNSDHSAVPLHPHVQN
jgi:RNA recognition motif-containing protein